jgi:hypothetical protein
VSVAIAPEYRTRHGRRLPAVEGTTRIGASFDLQELGRDLHDRADAG